MSTKTIFSVRFHNNTQYFDISKNDGSISYKHNYEKIDNEKAYNGFFLLLTTDTEKNADEILEIYKRKDLVTKKF